MKRKRILVLVFLLLIGMISGCKKNATDDKVDASAYEKIQKQLTNMTSYESKATVKYISNKNTNEYETLQQCKTSGEYRIEVTGPEKVAGNITMYDGSTIYQQNKKISGKIAVSTKETQERSEILFTSFLKNYTQSNEIAVMAATIDEGKCTVLEATIPGEHPFLAKEKLWIDNKTLNPVQLSIYDQDGSERISVTYNTFAYNVDLEGELFKP